MCGLLKEKYDGHYRDVADEDICQGIPWCLIFADDIVLVSETLEGLNGRLEWWREAVEDYDFNKNVNDQNDEAEIRIGERPHESFVTHRIQAGRLKWRAAT
ncbi:hypothetical protein Tco_1027703 [Tanacetum coccineum]